jgi:hypothetical protein
MDSTVVDSVLTALNEVAAQYEGGGFTAVAVTSLLALLSRVVVLWKGLMKVFPQWGPRVSAFATAYGYQFFVQGNTGAELATTGFWQGLIIVGGFEALVRPFVGTGEGGLLKNYVLPILKKFGVGVIAIALSLLFIVGVAPVFAQEKPLLDPSRAAGVVGIQGAMYGQQDVETGESGLFSSGIESMLGLSYSAGSALSFVGLWDQNYGANPFAMIRGGGRLLVLPGDFVDVFVGADYVRYEGNFGVYGITKQDSWLAVVRIAWSAIRDGSDRTIIFARLGLDYDEPNDNHYFIKGALTYQFLGGKP